MRSDRELMGQLIGLKRSIVHGARSAGFERFLDQEHGIAISSFGVGPFERAQLRVAFHPGHGMRYELIDYLSGEWLDEPAKVQAKAELFVEAMTRLASRAERDSRTRSAIVAATNEVLAEARLLGHELELLGIQPTPTDVFGKSPREDDLPKVFDVTILLPHEEDGELTRGAFTLDAADPVEFAGYLRDRVIPELDELRSRW